MKLNLQLLLIATVAAADANTWPKHVPARISFEDLANVGDISSGSSSSSSDSDDIFWKTLREVGLLSITNIPGFNKQSMMKDLEDCLHRTSVGAPEFVFGEDSGGDDHHGGEGHQHRVTLATRTLAGTPDDILVATKSSSDTKKDDDDEAKPCGDLRASSRAFRESVQTVSEAIAARFGAATSTAVTKGGGDDNDNDNVSVNLPVERLINEGEHLEHFHSYYSEPNNEAIASTTNTIDWHTDQGMMLLFTPGQHKDGTTPDGFLIKLGAGSTVEVAFDSHVDDLVIMLGDGVNQYINGPSSPKSSPTNAEDLRAVPHAVSLPGSDIPRLWYGRMVLPPPEAIHPSGSVSFADLRTAMIRGDKRALALGCASASETARELMEDMQHDDGGGEEEDLKCDEGVSMLCWMRCMNYTDSDVGVESCASQSESHSLRCANEGGELWEHGVHSAEYFPRCLSSEEVVGSSSGGMDKEMDHSSMDHSSMDHSSMDDSSAAASRLGFGIAFGLFVTTIMLA